MTATSPSGFQVNGAATDLDGGDKAGGADTTVDEGSDIARPYEAAWRDYWDVGWRGVIGLPARRKAAPDDGYTGHAGIDPSYADCQAWADDRQARNIALRLPATVIGIDKDCWDGKTGDKSIADKEAQWGPLPKTWRSTSRGFDTGNGIWLYRVPEGTILSEEPLADVEVIQRHHRYVVCWPSIHPDDPRYEWLDERTGHTGIPRPDDLPYLPQAWIDGLHADKQCHAQADVSAEEVNAIIASMPKGLACDHMRRASAKVFDADGRHDGYRDAMLAVVGAGRRGCPGAEDNLRRLRRTFLADVTNEDQDPAHRRTKLQARKEWAELLHGAVRIAVAAREQGRYCLDDLSDWTGTQAEPLPEDGNEEGRWRLRTIDADQAVITRVKYLWADRIPLGANTLAPGEEGVGKSTVCTRVAADLTRGLLPGEYLGTPRHVIVVAPEDGVTDVAIPRLQQAGADLSMVTFVASRVFGDGQTNETGIVVPRDLALLADLVRQKNSALVWFDSFVSVMPDDMKTISYQDVNKVMQALKRFAEDMQVAVLAPWHLNKTSGSDTALRMMDSRGFRTAVRSLLLIVADPERPGEGLVALDKANATDATKVPALRYRLHSSEYPVEELDGDTGEIVVYTAHCGVADFIREESGFGRDAARAMLTPHMEREDDPKGWLRDYLTTAGESTSEDVYTHGKEAGHSRSAIHRASQRLGVMYREGGFPRRTWWRLPDQSPQVPYSQTTGMTGTTEGAEGSGESQKEMSDVSSASESQSSQSSQSRVYGGRGTTASPCQICGHPFTDLATHCTSCGQAPEESF